MFSSNLGEKINHLEKQRRHCANLVKVNYCVPGTMSRCSAGITWQEQKKCKFAKKSTVKNRCMHYIESIDGHCDSVEAQGEFRNHNQCENSNLRE